MQMQMQNANCKCRYGGLSTALRFGRDDKLERGNGEDQGQAKAETLENVRGGAKVETKAEPKFGWNVVGLGGGAEE